MSQECSCEGWRKALRERLNQKGLTGEICANSRHSSLGAINKRFKLPVLTRDSPVVFFIKFYTRSLLNE